MILSKNFLFTKLLLILSKIVCAVKEKLLLIFFVFVCAFTASSQVNVQLKEQFNGRYDFTFVGNTLNSHPNGPVTDPVTGIPTFPPCSLLSSSSATLNLGPSDVIHKAFLYWSASGTGDLTVKLNGQDITSNPEHTYSLVFQSTENINGVPTLVSRDFFSAFADVTAQVQATGNGTYTFSDLDISEFVNENTGANINLYCRNGTNFGGWVIVVIYENPALPLNQLNLYDGLQNVPNEVNITLNSLNVIDNIGAKIGFVAWEGDANLAQGERLQVNGLTLLNALNPPTNAFNGTNTVTGQTNMYNMDLDIYNIQNYITVGDETADIKLTSTADFVMINAVLTLLNSQLPDATITADNLQSSCNSRVITMDYVVSNTNSTDPLPANTPIAIYINVDLIATTQTNSELPIGGSENGSVTLTIPDSAGLDFELLFVVDDQGNGMGGIVTETDETNNTFMINISLPASPPLQDPADITACNLGDSTGLFNFSGYETSLKNNPSDNVTFYLTQANAENETGNITNSSAFTSTSNPQEIFVRLEDEDGCYTIGWFLLITEDCDLPDATIVLGAIEKSCNSRLITVEYTVNNFDSMDVLPANTSIAIYADGEFIEFTETTTPLAVGESESSIISITIPANIPLDFELMFVVDDTGDGTGIVNEEDENNNTAAVPFTLIVSPDLQQPEDIIACNEGLGIGTFNFSNYADELKNNPGDMVTFYNTLENAQQDTDRIYNTSSFESLTNPQEIFVRLFDGNCYTTGSFLLYTKNCPPETYNYVTPNGDGINDTFFVKGLRNIFLNFEMKIYNRWGNLVWTGNHSQEDWNGIANEEKVGPEDTAVPPGTYYFVLELNDPDYPKPFVGWVYVTK